MKSLLPCAIIAIALSGCGGSSDESYTYEDGVALEDGYADGTYCASVDYYNSNTGTSSTYTLEVEIEGNEITTIHWPNGGWLDDSHFSPTDISSGSASFTSDQGYDYNVSIIGEGGSCSTDTYIEEDVAEETEDYTLEDSYYSEDTYTTEEEEI